MVVDRVSYRVGRRSLLNNVSFGVAPGELVTMLGPNGAGKSTLLGMISGELTPSEGTITWQGIPVAKWDPRALARTRAVVCQHSTLSFAFSCLDVVLLGRSCHPFQGRSKHERELALEAMRDTGTLSLAHRSYTTLSGGERQRVQIARALVQLAGVTGPRLLLLDEPTSSLDPAHQQSLLSLACELREHGCAVLCVLHDLNLAASYADRILLLRQGTLVADGTPSEVLRADTLSSLYETPVRVLDLPDHPTPIVLTLRHDNHRAHSPVSSVAPASHVPPSAPSVPVVSVVSTGASAPSSSRRVASGS